MSSAEKQQVTKQGTKDPEAYELYLKGRYEWNKRTPASLAAAIAYFNQAIGKDPGYAMAYLGLADTYGVLPSHGGSPSEDYPKSNAASRRALELDPTLAQPHADLGVERDRVRLRFCGRRRRNSRRRLHSIPTTRPHTSGMRKIWVRWAGPRKLLRKPRGHTSWTRYRRLSPQLRARVYISARQYDEAIVEAKRVAAENPTFPVAHLVPGPGLLGERYVPAGH